MNPNTPVGCPQCGGQMDLWQAGRRLALTGLFASVTDWIEVDIYRRGHRRLLRSRYGGAGQMPGLRQGASP